MNEPSNNISTSPDCLYGICCGLSRNKTGKMVIWIVAIGDNTALLLVHQSGCSVESISVDCCCSEEIEKLETIAKYLDVALACGKYNALVLVGLKQAMNTLKKHLSIGVHNRIIAEIDDDITGKNSYEIAQRLASFMPLF